MWLAVLRDVGIVGCEQGMLAEGQVVDVLSKREGVVPRLLYVVTPFPRMNLWLDWCFRSK